MTAFQWALILSIIIGFVAPFWTMVGLIAFAMKRPDKIDKTKRVHEYNTLMDYLHRSINNPKDGGQPATSLVSSVREMKSFPEFRDLSILYLEEVNITGTSKFDELLKSEIKMVEAFLLKADDD